MFEIFSKFSEVDKAIFKCLSLIEKQKDSILENQQRINSADSTINEFKNEVNNFREHMIMLNNRMDQKHSRKYSSSKRAEMSNMESIIENKVMQNLKKFDKVLNKMINFDNQMVNMKSHIKSLDSKVHESLSHFTADHTIQSRMMNTEDRNISHVRDKSSSDSEHANLQNDDKSSMSSAIKHFKETRPELSRECKDVSPDLIKFVSTQQKGRNTACQPTIRESPNNIMIEEKKLNSTKRKSSMPNAPFMPRNTRNPRRGATSAFINRHFSTERSQGSHYQNHSCVIGNATYNSCGSNHYSPHDITQSINERNPQFIEALKRRGLGSILKQS